MKKRVRYSELDPEGRRAYHRERKRASRARTSETDGEMIEDLVTHFGSQTVIAAQVIRQALDDARALRAGKCFGHDHPFRAHPHDDLQTFFAGEWCAFLAAHLGIDPAALVRMAQM